MRRSLAAPTDTTLRPGDTRIDDSETRGHYGAKSAPAELHLLKSGSDHAADAVAMFTSLFGHPPSDETIAELRRQK